MNSAMASCIKKKFMVKKVLEKFVNCQKVKMKYLLNLQHFIVFNRKERVRGNRFALLQIEI